MTRRCNRNGEVYMVSDTGSDFRASYQAEGGSIRDVTVHSHGHGFLTRPQLMIDDPECRCGSYITGFKIIYGGIGLTSTGSITVTGAEGGRGYMATFTTVNGSLADFNVLVRGSGYVQSSTLSWQLRCFNETTVTTDDCNGGENLVYATFLDEASHARMKRMLDELATHLRRAYFGKPPEDIVLVAIGPVAHSAPAAHHALAARAAMQLLHV